MQYLTTIVNDSFRNDIVIMRRPLTNVIEYCTSQAKLSCPSREATNVVYIDLVVFQTSQVGIRHGSLAIVNFAEVL